MKILHTADWHLGKRLDHFSRLEEQRAVMEEICELAEREQVDAVIVAGDLYDQFNPATEATELFYRTLKRLAGDGKRAVVGIAGNHDSPDRIEAPDPLARECGIILAGFPDTVVQPFALAGGIAVTRSGPGWIELKLPGTAVPLRLILAPFANEIRLRQFLGKDQAEGLRDALGEMWGRIADDIFDEEGVNMLVGHALVMRYGEAAPEEPEEEKPISTVGGAPDIFTSVFPEKTQYVALGHLHGYRVVQAEPFPVVYSSSPLAYSMSEAGQTKQVVLIDAEPGKPVQWRPVSLTSGKSLVRKRCASVDDAVLWLQENTGVWVELTVQTPTFLTSEERQRLFEVHTGIVTLIPEPIDTQDENLVSTRHIDLSKSIEALFADYFMQKQGLAVPDRLMDLFREVLAVDSEKE